MHGVQSLAVQAALKNSCQATSVTRGRREFKKRSCGKHHSRRSLWVPGSTGIILWYGISIEHKTIKQSFPLIESIRRRRWIGSCTDRLAFSLTKKPPWVPRLLQLLFQRGMKRSRHKHVSNRHQAGGRWASNPLGKMVCDSSIEDLISNRIWLSYCNKAGKLVTESTSFSKITFGHTWQSLWHEVSQYPGLFNPMMTSFCQLFLAALQLNTAMIKSH